MKKAIVDGAPRTASSLVETFARERGFRTTWDVRNGVLRLDVEWLEPDRRFVPTKAIHDVSDGSILLMTGDVMGPVLLHGSYVDERFSNAVEAPLLWIVEDGEEEGAYDIPLMRFADDKSSAEDRKRTRILKDALFAILDLDGVTAAVSDEATRALIDTYAPGDRYLPAPGSQVETMQRMEASIVAREGGGEQPMRFTSETTWENERFSIEVHTGDYHDPDVALANARSALCIVQRSGKPWLVTNDGKKIEIDVTRCSGYRTDPLASNAISSGSGLMTDDEVARVLLEEDLTCTHRHYSLFTIIMDAEQEPSKAH